MCFFNLFFLLFFVSSLYEDLIILWALGYTKFLDTVLWGKIAVEFS